MNAEAFPYFPSPFAGDGQDEGLMNFGNNLIGLSRVENAGNRLARTEGYESVKTLEKPAKKFYCVEV